MVGGRGGVSRKGICYTMNVPKGVGVWKNMKNNQPFLLGKKLMEESYHHLRILQDRVGKF